jgi:hypothetical protein
MKYKNKLGIFVTCYDETKAIEQALLSLKSIISYPIFKQRFFNKSF